MSSNHWVAPATLACWLLCTTDARAQQEPDVDRVVLTIAPAATYLAALEDGGGVHLGPEIAIGARVTLDGSWSFVVRGRVGLAFDLVSPADERYDAAPCGWGFFCGGDTDMRYPLGGEIGVRVDDLHALGGVWSLALGAELFASGTAFLSSYEHVDDVGGLGGGMLLTLDFLKGVRWGFGVEAGGRVEVALSDTGIARERGWLAGRAGLRFSARW